jgi:hypothetical protein
MRMLQDLRHWQWNNTEMDISLYGTGRGDLNPCSVGLLVGLMV